MAGTCLAWLGAFALSNTAARSGEPAPLNVLVMSLVLAVVIGVAAALAGFPGARLGLGTMAVAYLPALALTVVVTLRGARR
jgi:lysylphosphatidylglycerol synthetase-like protein (DUF2156 family)